MKKLLSSSNARIVILVLILILGYGVKLGIDRYAPYWILHDLEKGRLKPSQGGFLKLPWYYMTLSASGIAYVSGSQNGQIFVVFPQSPYSEDAFRGLLITNRKFDANMITPCNSGPTCMSLLTPSVAADPSPPKTTPLGIGDTVSKGKGDEAVYLCAVAGDS